VKGVADLEAVGLLRRFLLVLLMVTVVVSAGSIIVLADELNLSNATIVSPVETEHDTLLRDTIISMTLFFAALLPPVVSKRRVYGLRGVIYYSLLTGVSFIAMALRSSVPRYMVGYDVNGTLVVNYYYVGNKYVALYYAPLVTSIVMLFIATLEVVIDAMEHGWGRRRTLWGGWK